MTLTQTKNLVSWEIVLNTDLGLFCPFPPLIVVICTVIAAIGYVLIGNGLYDEAIKHFSLLLQVCLHSFKLLNQLFCRCLYFYLFKYCFSLNIG